MLNTLVRLEKWRVERGLDKSQGFEFDLDTQMSFFFEEIGVEFLRAKTEEEKIDAYCDTIVFAINGSSLINHMPIYVENTHKDYKGILSCALFMLEFENIGKLHKDYYSIIFSIAKDNIIKLGYDFDKCMDETLKEIESRKGAANKETGKWEKFKDEYHQSLWYKADYSKCKI